MKLEREEWEAKAVKLLNELNQNKQISETIINQQKKLLDYLQERMKEDEPGNSHHNLINLFNKKKVQRSAPSPALVNLQKPNKQALVLKQQDLNKPKVYQSLSTYYINLNDF